MIRRHLMVLRLALMVVDAVSAAIVFALVSLVRFGDGDPEGLWRQIGVDESDYGHLTDSMFHLDSEPIDLGRYLQPRIEPASVPLNAASSVTPRLTR